MSNPFPAHTLPREAKFHPYTFSAPEAVFILAGTSVNVLLSISTTPHRTQPGIINYWATNISFPFEGRTIFVDGINDYVNLHNIIAIETLDPGTYDSYSYHKVDWECERPILPL